MDLENIYNTWGDIWGAIESKDTDPRLFHRLFIGYIAENGPFSYAGDTAKRSLPRQSPKSARTPVCFINEATPSIYLTRREAQCVACVVKGYTHPQAAQALDLSKRTVEFYIKNVRRKLNCKNKQELIKVVTESNFSETVDVILKQLQYQQ